jgi:hypothetical protein
LKSLNKNLQKLVSVGLRLPSINPALPDL